MTKSRTGLYGSYGLLGLGSILTCSNDRLVVVGRLHANPLDASSEDRDSVEPGLVTSIDASTLDASVVASVDGGIQPLPTLATTSSNVERSDAGCSLAAPAHRYAFAGIGTMVPDLGTGAAAELRGGATLSDEDSVTLDGVDDFVALPPGLLDGQTSVTVMLWVNYEGGPAYVRLFDFGTSSAGIDPPEGEASVGRSYLALTPATGYDPSGLTALAATSGSGSEVLASSDVQVGDENWHQLSVVLDGDALQLRLYFDGAIRAQATVEHRASAIANANNWLGRSQYDADPYLQVTYDEVRIYNEALADCAIATTFIQGPDVP